MRLLQLTTPVRRARALTRVVALTTAVLMSAPAGATASPLGASAPTISSHPASVSAGVTLEQVAIAPRTDLAAAGAAVAAHGGVVVSRLEGLGLLLAEIPSSSLTALSVDARVASVTRDRTLGVQSASFDTTASDPTTTTINAVQAWDAGHVGSGIGVAVVDTGIDTTHPDLAGRVTAVIDVTADRAAGDTHGHGTFLAGLVAGTGQMSNGRYPGVAPEAHLVAVKVADKKGRASMNSVLNGLEAVAVTADELGVRVVLLALSAPTTDGIDPLRIALQQLWARGLVVVVPSGNDGTVTSPGNDPYLLTAGALDTNATSDRSDDTIPAWSGSGSSDAGAAKPDVVAPGVSVVGPVAKGSLIEAQHAAALVQDGYIRGSGTSMSAAVLAGAAALLLDAEPGLTPDQVKGRLMGAASDAPATAIDGSAGAGVVDVAASIDSVAPAANMDLPALQVATPGDGQRGNAANSNANRSPNPNAGPMNAWRVDASGELTGWNWTGELTGWNWTGWNWTGWNWTGWNWAGWNWAGWNWAGWNWAAVEWG